MGSKHAFLWFFSKPSLIYSTVQWNVMKYWTEGYSSKTYQNATQDKEMYKMSPLNVELWILFCTVLFTVEFSGIGNHREDFNTRHRLHASMCLHREIDSPGEGGIRCLESSKKLLGRQRMQWPRTSQTDIEGHCHRSREWEMKKGNEKAGFQPWLGRSVG